MGDIVRVPYPYVEKARMEVRPALVVSVRPVGPDALLIWVAMITGSNKSHWPEDIDIGHGFSEYGLTIPSMIRPAKLAVIEAKAAIRIGVLPAELLTQTRMVLAETLGFHAE